MTEARIAAVIGLGFGDCGKGLFTDYLCRAMAAHTVVRFNGGAQAGHNVVLPDGRHHTFSQFGAASFQAGVATVLAAPVVLHPTALLVEEAALRRCGVDDALERLFIDGRCIVTTPYHEAAGRLRERARGGAAHGTCGVGFGETVRHALAWPDQAIRYADLVQPGRALDKLEPLRRAVRAALPQHALDMTGEEAALLDDPGFGPLWLQHARRLAERVAPAAPGQIAARLSRPGGVVLEGAQGMLLDQWHGFHPHTTWSSTGPAAAQAALAAYGMTEPIARYGVLRSYLTRHGAGPLPTEDARLAMLAERHNHGGGWQGAFRRGHPDAVLLRYAVAAAGTLDGLLLSHLDAITDKAALRWAYSYQAGGQEVTQLQPAPAPDLAHQQHLCALLAGARPCYAAAPIAGAAAFLDEVEAITGLAARFGAHGPTHRHVKPLRKS